MTPDEALGRAYAQRHTQSIADRRNMQNRPTVPAPLTFALIYNAYLAGWRKAYKNQQNEEENKS